MSVTVPLEELAAALHRRSNAAYLITVGDDGRAHCVASRVDWSGKELVLPAGRTSVRNAAARGHVVLLFPPAAGIAASPSGEDDFSLIVDAEVSGTAAAGEGAGSGEGAGEGAGEGTAASSVRARPVHAVLHRPTAAPDGRVGHDCERDCVHVYDGT